jgi:hypothetical protein
MGKGGIATPRVDEQSIMLPQRAAAHGVGAPRCGLPCFDGPDA